MTGTGKSSLLGLIPRFYDPHAGRILADGKDLRELDLDAYRRQIGIVYQESFLFSNTVSANIAFGHPHATMEQIERAARIASAHDFITALPHGYETVLGESGVDLSGGQRSGWRWRGRCCCNRRFSSWTTRRRRWMRGRRTRSCRH